MKQNPDSLSAVLFHWKPSFLSKKDRFYETVLWYKCFMWNQRLFHWGGSFFDKSVLVCWVGRLFVQAILYQTNRTYVHESGPVSISKGHMFIQFLCLTEWKGMESLDWSWFYESGPFTVRQVLLQINRIYFEITCTVSTKKYIYQPVRTIWSQKG